MNVAQRFRLIRFFPFAVLAFSLWCVFGRSISGGFLDIHGDLGDARLIHYLLEYTLTAMRGGISLWDPAFYFPEQGALAFSDTLLASAFPYWILRILRVDLYASYELWLISLCVLNFSAMYLLLRDGCRYGDVGSAMGAFLFSFASPRLAQITHPQLFGHFWTPLSVYFLINGIRSKRYRTILWCLSSLCVGAQFYASFYLGWFLVIAVLLSLFCGLFISEERAVFISLIRESYTSVIIAVFAVAALLLPLCVQYLSASSHGAFRSYQEIFLALPTSIDWIRQGSRSLLYYWIEEGTTRAFEHERRLGVGFLTMVITLIGFWSLRKSVGVRIIILASVCIIIFLSSFGSYSAWRFLYELVPGGSVIRAPSRFILVLLIPFSVAIGCIFDRLSAISNRSVYIVMLACAVFLEQRIYSPVYPATPTEATIEKLSQLLDNNRDRCRSFFYSFEGGRFGHEKYQLDAMWAGLRAGIPTVNGYSGISPKGWGLYPINTKNSDDRGKLDAALGSWNLEHNISPCRIIGDSTKTFMMQIPEQ